MARSVRPSVLCLAASSPGPCGHCRHSNQGTEDFAEGHVYCRWDERPRRRDTSCELALDLPRAVGGPLSPAFLFERFDGRNGTFGEWIDVRLIAGDAGLDVKQAARWDQLVIPAGEEL